MNRNALLFAICLSALFLASATTLAAEENPHSGSGTFAAFDKDGNGCISEEEFAAGHQARMQQHKKHGKKGCRSGSERKGKHMPAFEDFDTDGNGAMSETELMAGHAKHMAERAAAGGKMKHAGEGPSFTGIDSDGNGEISPEEFAAHQAERHGSK